MKCQACAKQLDSFGKDFEVGSHPSDGFQLYMKCQADVQSNWIPLVKILRWVPILLTWVPKMCGTLGTPSSCSFNILGTASP